AVAIVAIGIAVPTGSAQAGAIITNGTITMGVNEEGHLNTPFAGDPLGIGFMGLRYNPTGAASTEPGCQCEGWGVSNGFVSGYANVSSDGGAVGLTVNSFGSDASTATSNVTAAGIFNVIHDYHPSASLNLYQVDVSITNISEIAQALLYRRVMDWDIYPTPFDEFVTIVNSSATVFRTDTNGFNSANPLSFSSFAPGPMPSNGFTPVIDAGPSDHGALFDFDFGMLDAGATKTFTTFYGAGGTELEVLAALAVVSAENVYSFGQANVTDGPGLGVPNTFVFAFKGVGGTVVPNPVPEPASFLLFGSGLAGLAAWRRKKAA
ncbi:MAG: PEP-CTERM sorting domain-containing protein, partial [Patescibacteria group bacterium]